MKKIIISVAILIASNSFAQMTETKKLASGTSEWKINMKIENGTDTTTYFYYGYQNKAYDYITDIGSVFFTEEKELIDFANALKSLSTKESGTQVQLQISSTTLKLYDFSNNIYIEDSRGKYTYITKKQAVKLADEFLLNAKYLRK